MTDLPFRVVYFPTMEISDVLSELFTLNNLNDCVLSFISPTQSNGYLAKDFGKELKIPNFTSRVSDFIFLAMSSKGSSVQNSLVLMVICKVSRLQYTHWSCELSCVMFTREQASLIKQEFWTTFGKYMRPILSVEGIKINWINYHTGVKDVHFRMNVDQHSAVIYIAIQHADPEIQELYFEQFLELKELLEKELEETWEWQLKSSGDDGKPISKIYRELAGASVFNRDHWPELISFFKQRIIALDRFWEDAKYSFESLR